LEGFCIEGDANKHTRGNKHRRSSMPNKEFEIDSYTGVCKDISIIIIQIIEKICPWLSSEEVWRRRRDEYKIRTEDYSPRQSYKNCLFY